MFRSKRPDCRTARCPRRNAPRKARPSGGKKARARLTLRYRFRHCLAHIGAGIKHLLDQRYALYRARFHFLDAGDVEKMIFVIGTDEAPPSARDQGRRRAAPHTPPEFPAPGKCRWAFCETSASTVTRMVIGRLSARGDQPHQAFPPAASAACNPSKNQIPRCSGVLPIGINSAPAHSRRARRRPAADPHRPAGAPALACAIGA